MVMVVLAMVVVAYGGVGGRRRLLGWWVLVVVTKNERDNEMKRVYVNRIYILWNEFKCVKEMRLLL